MIIDITTGFFPCTGRKPGCPWSCLADRGGQSYMSSIWTGEGHNRPTSTAPGEQTVAKGHLADESPTSQVTWGFPMTKPALKVRLQQIHTTAETSKIPSSLQRHSQCLATDLQSVRKQRARQVWGDEGLFLSLNKSSLLLPRKLKLYLIHIPLFSIMSFVLKTPELKLNVNNSEDRTTLHSCGFRPQLD